MKLQDYFREQQQKSLSHAQKHEIFHTIQKNINQPVWYTQITEFFVTKRFIYAAFTICIIALVYGTSFFQNTYNGDWFIIQNGVQADHIAQVIDVDWDFFIEHKGSKIISKNISQGDTVTLDSKAKLVIHIDDDTQATLQWPARFSVERDEQDSSLLIIHEGDFVDIRSLKESPKTFTISFDDLRVVSKQEAQAMIDFSIQKKGEKRLVSNNGAKLHVTTVDEEKEIQTDVSKQETLAIADNDISLIDDVTQVATIIAQRDVSQTTALSVTTWTLWETGDNLLGMLLAITQESTKEDKQVSQEVTQALSSIVSVDKKVINTMQNQQLRSAVNPAFIQNDIKDLYIAYLVGNETNAYRSTATISQRIKDIYTTFDKQVPVLADSSIQGQLNYIQTLWRELISYLEEGYYIPPSQIRQIQTVVSWISHIQTLEYNSVVSIQVGEKNWSALQVDLPSHLRF